MRGAFDVYRLRLPWGFGQLRFLPGFRVLKLVGSLGHLEPWISDLWISLSVSRLFRAGGTGILLSIRLAFGHPGCASLYCESEAAGTNCQARSVETNG